MIPVIDDPVCEPYGCNHRRIAIAEIRKMHCFRCILGARRKTNENKCVRDGIRVLSYSLTPVIGSVSAVHL